MQYDLWQSRNKRKSLKVVRLALAAWVLLYSPAKDVLKGGRNPAFFLYSIDIEKLFLY